MCYGILVEPNVSSIPHFVIKLNGSPVACARDYRSAYDVAADIEAQEMRRLIARNGNKL